MRKFFQAMQAYRQYTENKALVYFADENIEKENLERLMKSRKQLILFQIFPFLLAVIGIIAVFIFIPSEEVPYGYASSRETVLLFGTVGFIFFYIIWIILSQFIVGRLWHRYVKWFRRDGTAEGLQRVFDE